MPKILIFEDDKFLGGMYSTKYKMEGFESALYESPSVDPVAIVLKEKPDIISMGVIMPVMNGFEATQRIKADPRTKSIPIFGLDNLSQAEDVQRAREAGMDDYFVMAKHMPIEVVNFARKRLGLPIPPEKPIPPPKDAWHGQSVADLLPDKPKPWWKKLFG